MGRKFNQGFYNAGSRPQDKSKVGRKQVDKGRGTSEGVMTSGTEKNGQLDAEADNQHESSSVKPTAGSEPVSEKRPSLHIINAQQSNMDDDSTNSSTNTNSSTSSSYTENTNSTNTKSRTSSISSIDSAASGTLSKAGLCESCDKLRISKEKCNNYNNESGDGNSSSDSNAKHDNNANTNNNDSASHERDDKRILIGAQEALHHIQSHELFHRGLVDIEYLLCALRRVARYYKGAAVFDRAELELAVEESAMEGRSDELI